MNGDPNFIFNLKSISAWDFKNHQKKKIRGKGTESTIRDSFVFTKGTVKPTVTLVSRDPLSREIEPLIKSLGSNPFIMDYYVSAEYFKDTDDSKAFLSEWKKASFCERMDGDLQAYLSKCNHSEDLPLAHVLWLIYSLISGVEFLHSQGILHRDLKLLNILFSKGIHGPIFKIGDFGAIIQKRSVDKMTPFAGTSAYLSFDNFYFESLIKELRRKKIENGGKFSEEEFIDTVNGMKRDRNGLLFGKKLEKISDFPVTQILWNKFENDEKFTCQKTYAHRKEDVYQLYFIIRSIVWRFKNLNDNNLPSILQSILSKIEGQLILTRGKREDLTTFKFIFLDLLNGYIAGNQGTEREIQECYSLFCQQTTLLKVGNPIRVPLAIKSVLPEEKIRSVKEISSVVLKQELETKLQENKEEKSADHKLELYKKLSAIINDGYWEKKTTYGVGVSEGISKMRSQLKTDSSFLAQVEQNYQNLRQIAEKKLTINYNHSFFKKRDTNVNKFYEILQKCENIEDLKNNVEYNKVLTEAQKTKEEYAEIRNMLF